MMMKTTTTGSLLVVGLTFCLFFVVGALAQTQYCPGTPNTNPVVTEAPVLVNEVANGKLYMQGNTTVTPNLLLLSLWGTPYEMGYAHGQLLASQIKTLFPQVSYPLKQHKSGKEEGSAVKTLISVCPFYLVVRVALRTS